MSVAEQGNLQIAVHLIGKSEGVAQIGFGDELKKVQVYEGTRKIVVHELFDSQEINVLFNDEQQSGLLQIQRLNSNVLQEQLYLIHEYFPSSLQGNKDLSK